MNLLQEYNSGSDDDASISIPKVNSAPSISMSAAIQYRLANSPSVPVGEKNMEVFHNPEYSTLWAPLYGPQHPHHQPRAMHPTGFSELIHVNGQDFHDQYHSFHTKGYAVDPTTVSNFVYNISGEQPKTKRKRRSFGDASDTTEKGFRGPWAPYEETEASEPTEVASEEQESKEDTDAANKIVNESVSKQLDKEQKDIEKKEEEETEEKKQDEIVEAKSIFHGTQLRDYLGRSYVDPPTYLKPNKDHECFLPKRIIHSWSAHEKGVSSIRLNPNYGHLLLSAGMDSKVKLWDVYNNQKCIRTFMGHSKAVRDICFSNDGRRFLSCSYDKNINLWDTETGECLASFNNGKIPYCVKFNPDKDKQHIFLAGYADKRIIQWDTNSGKITQEYDQHLGAVNTITFVDDNRRFVTTSDDKSIRVWEWGIPVVIKYISEPHMHSIPAVSLHPSGQWICGQSLDNQILVYGTKDRFRLNKKKKFTGHITAGYACKIGFSPDGHFIMSGDSEGKVWFWDFQNSRFMKTLKVHDGVCIGCEWHPIEPSRVFTCGWDGTIKLLD